MNPATLIAWPARVYPDRAAFKCEDKEMTFGEFYLRVNKLSNGLRSLGLKKGDHCGLLMTNRTEFVESWFAVNIGGLAVIRMNYRDEAETHEYILRHSGASAIIISDEFKSELSTIRKNLPQLRHCIAVNSNGDKEFLDYEEIIFAQSGDEPNVEVNPEDLDCIRYTSGTTGKPKGAAMTYGSTQAWVRNFFLNMDRLITPDDICLNAAPLAHAGRLITFPYYYKGAKNIILPRFDPRLVLETIQEERATVSFLIPTMINRLLDYPDLKSYDISSLKRIFYGTSPISPERLKLAIDHFGPIFRQNYGMTEANMPLICLLPEQHVTAQEEKSLTRLSSVGKPALGVEVKLVDDNNAEVRQGEIGEIVIRSENAMRGYWKNKEETDRILKNGWLHTGDLARVDDEGFIYIVDRKKDVIISGGFNIYPKEIENVINSHPDVKEVAVIGVPDDKWGEAVKAFILPHVGRTVDIEEIIKLCETKLARYKKPKFFEIVDSFERGATGKIMKNDLRDKEWKGYERRVH